jgi:hypothetical protein
MLRDCTDDPATRRTRFDDGEKRLLERIRGEHWSADELDLLLVHLDEDAPTLVIAGSMPRSRAKYEDSPPQHVSCLALLSTDIYLRGEELQSRGMPVLSGTGRPKPLCLQVVVTGSRVSTASANSASALIVGSATPYWSARRWAVAPETG